MDFNIGNLVSAAVGAVVKVAVAIVNAVGEALLGALAAVAEAREDGELSDEQAEEIFEEKFKALLGAYMLSIESGSNSESDGEDSDEVYLNEFNLPIQVTDGAAVTYDNNGGPSEEKSVWDCVLGVKDYICSGLPQIHEETKKPTRVHVGESGDGFWGKVADVWVSSPIYDGLASMAEWQYDNPKATEAINFAGMFIAPRSPAGISGLEKESEVIENRSMKLANAESKIEKVIKGEAEAVNISKSVERQVKKLTPEARKGYDKAIDALKSRDTRGLNEHPLTGNRAGQWAVDIKGTGRGRGAGRVIYQKNNDGSIDIIEILTDHKY